MPALQTSLSPPPDSALFENAFHHAAIGMALVDPAGRILRANQALQKMLGYSEAELLRLDFRQVSHPEDLEQDLRLFHRLLSGELSEYQLEKRYFHRTGEEIWGLLSVSLIQDHSGAPLYTIAQVQDITKQKRGHEGLRLASARLHLLMDNLDMGVVLEDEDRTILMVNRAFCDIFRLPPGPESLTGRNGDHIAEEARHLFARPEFLTSRLREIRRHRRPVHQETVELADGRVLTRDYIPVFVDRKYRGQLWTWRDISTDRTGPH